MPGTSKWPFGISRQRARTWPLLADHARAYLARVEERRGRLSDAARHWHAILNTPNDSVWQGPAALALARQAIDSGDAAAARGLVARARNKSLLHPERASALWIEARIERQAGSASEARRLRDRVRELYAALPEGREAAKEAWATRTESLVSLRRAEAEIHRWISALRADRAVMLAREARARLPAAGDQAPLAWLEAEGLRIAGNLDGAESHPPRNPAALPREPRGRRSALPPRPQRLEPRRRCSRTEAPRRIRPALSRRTACGRVPLRHRANPLCGRNATARRPSVSRKCSAPIRKARSAAKPAGRSDGLCTARVASTRPKPLSSE